ncbi:MAG: PLP-dependent aminotransferase family protein [Nitrospirota bacterium]
MSFDGESPPSLFNLAKSGNYIYMSTFSKTIAPGFRVAFIAADEEMIAKLSVIKQGTDLHTNTFGQYVINEYLESGCYDEHILLLKKEYKYRRDCMIAAMEQYFPSSVTWNRPGGGMFLWVKLPEQCDANQLFSICIDHNVAFVPGQEFFPDSSGKNTMRLNFSNASPANIEEGIKRMGNVMSDTL